MENVIYSLKNVKKMYLSGGEKTHALDGVSFDILKGEVIVILGPSGSGKSTMLNILSGIDVPSSGKVEYFGNQINKLSDRELTAYRKDNLGFIFQSYNLVSNLNIYENVELGAHLSNNSLDISTLLSKVGLDGMNNKFPYQLSGGQMQRVAIARAVAKNPSVLFCDEPTGALDEKMGKQTLKLLQDINKSYGTTIIIVTHNPSIANLANMVIKMNSGKVSEIYKNKEIMNAEDIRWA